MTDETFPLMKWEGLVNQVARGMKSYQRLVTAGPCILVSDCG